MEHTHAHTHDVPAGAGITWLALAALASVLCSAIAYWRGVRCLQRSGRTWPASRTSFFLSGCAVLAVGIAPPLVQAAMTDFRLHMLQHLLVGMLAPLGLVLGAPVSLLIRNLPRRHVGLLVRLLHGAWLRCVAHPVAALLLNVGAMYMLYLSPLYDAMHASLAVHAFVHVHVFLAGCLFTWSMLGGPDPVPRRYANQLRLAVLFIGIAAHTVLSKLMYAYGLPAGTHPIEQIKAGAQWMYYGGDLAELLLLTALFARWRTERKDAGFFRDTIFPETAASGTHRATQAVGNKRTPVTLESLRANSEDARVASTKEGLWPG